MTLCLAMGLTPKIYDVNLLIALFVPFAIVVNMILSQKAANAIHLASLVSNFYLILFYKLSIVYPRVIILLDRKRRVF